MNNARRRIVFPGYRRRLLKEEKEAHETPLAAASSTVRDGRVTLSESTKTTRRGLDGGEKDTPDCRRGLHGPR